MEHMKNIKAQVEEYYKTLTPQKLSEILSELSEDEKQFALNKFIIKNNPKAAFVIMDSGIELRRGINNVNLQSVIAKKSCVELLKGLTDRGMNLNQGMGLLFKAALADNPKIENIVFLLEQIQEPNSKSIYISALNLINKTLMFPKIYDPVLKLLVAKMSSTQVEELVNSNPMKTPITSVKVLPKVLAWSLKSTDYNRKRPKL